MFNQGQIEKLHSMSDRAKRVSAMIRARAVREFGLAFGSDRCERLDMCVLHNSLIAHSEGKPWSEVNYTHMRRANWLINKSFEPSRLVNSWYRRQCGIA